MCGIFGICYSQAHGLQQQQLRDMLDRLYCLSQSRGKEASGILVKSGEDLTIVKDSISGDRFIKSEPYKKLFSENKIRADRFTLIMGHARLDTNGSKQEPANNAPIQYENIHGIHNGIVTNVDELWKSHPHLPRFRVVDSEVILALYFDALGAGLSEAEAMQVVFGKIEGSASVSLYSEARQSLLLATNTGSLYVMDYGNGMLVYASEEYILLQLKKKFSFLRKPVDVPVQKIKPRTCLVYAIRQQSATRFEGN